MVLDLEWDGNDPGQKLLALGIGHKSYPADAIPASVLSELADPLIDKMTFTKADHRWLMQHGFKVRGDIIDVQTLAWCYDERTRLDLDWCVKHYLDKDPDKRIHNIAGKVMFKCDDGEDVLLGDAPIDQLLAYNERDMLYTGELYNELVRRLTATKQYDYWEKMHKPFTRVLLDMEMNGIPINLKETRKMAEEVREGMAHLEVRLKTYGQLPPEFNLGSNTQMVNYLFTDEFEFPARIAVTKEQMQVLKDGDWPVWLPTNFIVNKLGRDYVHGVYVLKGLGMKPKIKAPKCKEKKCEHPSPADCTPSVSSKTLKVFHGDNPWVESLLEWRLLDKANQFLTVWLDVARKGRIYARFNQTGTATGRLSSSEPNLQNIPSRGALGSRIRGLFQAPAGSVLVNGDYNQIEPRLMAHFSQDPMMLKAFHDRIDIYEQATVAVLGQRYPKGTPERQLVRTCFLAMGYGAQPAKIRSNLAEEGFRFPLWKVEKAYNGIVELYQVFWDWKDVVVAEAKENHYVETIAGHRRHLSFDRENAWKAERQAVNSRIQGSAADIVQTTMIIAAETFPTWKMIAAVHDEIMWETTLNEASKEIINVLQMIAEEGHGFKLNVPLVFEPKVVKSWQEAK